MLLANVDVGDGALAGDLLEGVLDVATVALLVQLVDLSTGDVSFLALDLCPWSLEAARILEDGMQLGCFGRVRLHVP